MRLSDILLYNLNYIRALNLYIATLFKIEKEDSVGEWRFYILDAIRDFTVSEYLTQFTFENLDYVGELGTLVRLLLPDYTASCGNGTVAQFMAALTRRMEALFERKVKSSDCHPIKFCVGVLNIIDPADEDNSALVNQLVVG